MYLPPPSPKASRDEHLDWLGVTADVLAVGYSDFHRTGEARDLAEYKRLTYQYVIGSRPKKRGKGLTKGRRAKALKPDARIGDLAAAEQRQLESIRKALWRHLLMHLPKIAQRCHEIRRNPLQFQTTDWTAVMFELRSITDSINRSRLARAQKPTSENPASHISVNDILVPGKGDKRVPRTTVQEWEKTDRKHGVLKKEDILTFGRTKWYPRVWVKTRLSAYVPRS